MNKVFKNDNGTYGIEADGAVLYDDNFLHRWEAELFAKAHDKGAKSYEEAFAMIYGEDADPATYPPRSAARRL